MSDRSSSFPSDRRSPPIAGSSAALRGVISLATHAAAKNVKILITGESGVGKDVLARFIHANSLRAAECFVALNCAGLAESLLESELFGHVRGSFTGAYRDRVGHLERAHRGTIFLDEIGDMGPRLQGLLLRFLETGELRRVGSDGPPARVDVRVIAATNRDLHEMVRAGAFREDLFYRINVVHIHVPPLRDRPEDVVPLLRHFLATSGTPLEFGAEALRQLEQYRWPGNVRELQNVVEQVTSLVSGRPVEPADLPRAIVVPGPRLADRCPDRRRSLAEDLYEGLTTGRIRFWEDIHPLFIQRDITRADLRRLTRRGLAVSSGSYRGLLKLFGMPQDDYKRLLNFLSAHDCATDSREFRPAAAALRAAVRPGTRSPTRS
jgi:transcriptional regulator with PAS, ATPase and Fis domain